MALRLTSKGLVGPKSLVSKRTYLLNTVTPLKKVGSNFLITSNFKRNIGFIRVIGKAVRLPAYLGGGLAAGSSYVVYKLEQASTAAQDSIGGIKDFANGVFDKATTFFENMDGPLSEQANPGNGGDGGDGGGSDTATALGATAAAVGISADDEDNNENDDDEDDEDDDDDEETLIDDEDDEDNEEEAEQTNDDMLNLTRQMIEIRNLLLSVDQNDTLKLPSIVVIGSQSSGKSSVLEAIVGHEFLPKGSNMVTRRPIELTLVNSPEAAAETAEFPALRINNLTNFEEVQKMLYDLNMAVPATECISADPIQITIRSPKVPDLSLVDLPGYIQIEAADQPIELKQKIREVCDRYLEAPNIILAISAADVDLANSSALRAAKVADPRGERTLGVITKLDLVSPLKAKKMLLNKKYPLKMGYVGVITKAPKRKNTGSGGLFGRKEVTGYQAYVAQQNFEISYLKEHKQDLAGTITGTNHLKKRLMKVLEKSMAASLRPTHLAIQQELEEASYRFKVEFNDRPLTPQMYLANNIDVLKLSTKELADKFTRKELKEILKQELDQKVLNLLAERYWNKPFKLNEKLNSAEHNLRELSQIKNIDDDIYWHKKLDLATNSLTKLGIGRISTSLVSNALVTEILNLVDTTQLRNHPMARNAVLEAAKSVLGTKYYSTADQVENSVKPFKYEIEIEDREWNTSKANAVQLLKEEIRQCDEVYNNLKKQVGGRKLNQVMIYLEKLNQQRNTNIDYNSNEALGFSQTLIEKGQDAIFLKERLSLLEMRYHFIKGSKKCRKKENKYQCPEIFLDAVATKLIGTAVLFLNVELLSDFYYNFPRELDVKFFNNLTKEEIDKFAKEDPKIKNHIELQERKDLLETALNKIEGVLAIQRTKGGVMSENTKESIFKW